MNGESLPADQSNEQLEVAALVADARRRAGLSQVDAAKRLGVSQSRLAKIETGRRRLAFVEALRLADLYEVSLESFVPQRLRGRATRPEAS